MGKLKGQNLRLFIGDGQSDAIPEETNCSITMTGNAEDVTTKDSSGLYVEEAVVNSSWSANADTFQSEPSQLKALFKMFSAAEPVGLGWSQTSGDLNRTPVAAGINRKGKAILNDATFTFNDRATITSALQFQGTGPLEKVS